MSRYKPGEPVIVSSVGYERGDGSLGRYFIGQCASIDAYAAAVSTAVAEARADDGHHLVVQITEAPSGRLISALYVPEVWH
jgi:hypothetical protein